MSARRTGARLLARTLALGLTAATLGLVASTAPATAGPLTDLYPWGPGDLVGTYIGNEPYRLGAGGTGATITSGYTNQQSYGRARGAAVDASGTAYVLRSGASSGTPAAIFKVTRSGDESLFATLSTSYYVANSSDLTVLPDGDVVVPMASYGTFETTFVRVSRTGGFTSVLASVPNSIPPLGVGADRSGTLHWATVLQGGVSIYRASGFGGYTTVATVPTPSGTSWGGFDVDPAGNLYLLNRTNSGQLNATIYKLPRDGSSPVVLAADSYATGEQGLGSATGLAWLSTGEVAWQRIASGGLRVYRTPDSDATSTTDVTNQGFYAGLTPSTLLNAFPPLPFTDAVDASFTGTAKVGQELTASGGTFAPATATLSYAWKVAGTQAGTGSTYTPVAADAGKSLTLTVTGKLSGYTDSVSTTTGVTVQAAGVAPTITGTTEALGTRGSAFSYTPTVTGDPTPEVTLVEGPLPAGLELATTGAITGTPTEPGLYPIRLKATNAAGTADHTVQITIVKAFIGFAPTISGDPVVGAILTAGTGDVTPAPEYTQYQWQYDADGIWTDLDGATSATYELGLADLGRSLRAVVTIGGSAPERSGATDAVGPVTKKPSTIDAPAITGEAKVGQTLTCAPADGTPGALTYQWLRGDEVLGEESTYELLPADADTTVTCAVTADQGVEYDVATAAAEPVQVKRGVFTIDAPTITGVPQIGTVLTCAAPEGTFTWHIGRDVLAQGATYRVRPADQGQHLRCTVEVERAGYELGRATAQTKRTAFAGAAGTYDVTVTSVKGSKAVVGVPLTATVAATGDTPEIGSSRVSWQWSADGTPIAGATKASFVPGPAQYGAELTATATVKREGFKKAQPTASAGTVELNTLRLVLAPNKAAAGTTVAFTVRNLLPGQHWNLTYGDGRGLAKGDADGQVVEGSFVVPEGLGPRTVLTLRTFEPDRSVTRTLGEVPAD